MEPSFLKENIRHWTRSVGLWCCLMVGVVTFAQFKPVQQPLAAASLTADVHTAPLANVDARVTLSYSTLDLSAHTNSAYGDYEF